MSSITKLSYSAWIALGGNLGEVKQAMCSAIAMLDARDDCVVLDKSLLYQTPPMGQANQPDYLNAVVAISTHLSAMDLLDTLQQIELLHGRQRREHWGARTLDLDILDYDACIEHSTRLILPHPYMHERVFVLRPFCDIAPLWVHPKLKQTAQTMLNALLAQDEADLPQGEVW